MGGIRLNGPLPKTVQTHQRGPSRDPPRKLPSPIVEDKSQQQQVPAIKQKKG